MNTYLDFITDEDLFECIDILYSGYRKALAVKNIEDFMENRIDPIKFLFDTQIMEIPIKEYIERELIRQSDRSISNYIGDFHENLLGKINGYEKRGRGKSIDIQSLDGKLIADIKNKHNTVKGENKVNLFKKLKNHLDDPKDPAEIAYYVRMIDKSSTHKKWTVTYKEEKYEHDKIYIISGDEFYDLLTKREGAFSEVCSILPQVLNDYIAKLPQRKLIEISDDTIVEEIEEYYEIDGEAQTTTNDEFLRRLFQINFYEKSQYKMFKNFQFTSEEKDN